MLREKMTNRSRIIVVAAGVALMAAAARGQGGNRPIDASHSTLTVFVYKSGLFSAFADNHVIKAPIAGGSIAEESSPRVDLAVHAADLTVIDPGLADDRRPRFDAHARAQGARRAKFHDIVQIRRSRRQVKIDGP
jgi:hypothetical protein